MCKAMQDMRNEAIEKGRIQNAMEMLKDGLSIEKVAQYSRLAIERVKELAMLRTAKVTNKGVIKAVAPGTCSIYAYAQNGVCAKVAVTVLE